ncbi:EPIDERMAL PATTERNING FACTOR-like protein 8 isoform X2 [Oryza sativa Japonica Group]|uniref:EPIDERMAL PATTERNING FACTOR-like protein 8 isoform X2 n=1 Tax=Oryza sativa subsp. japonica TaxID=39947 RepID=UPI0001C7ED5C|nr:EPIDERMAL PATTERNING FACTOR-like protein 8 isoform X2 [Oryza sativa Japonica Group]
MASSGGRWRRSGSSMLKLVVALCFFAVAISLCCVCLSSGCGGSGCGGFRRRAVLLRLDFRTRATAYFGANQDHSSSGRRWRRLLAEGPGSYPPRCTAKCGACVPCYPVHVAVPPGVPVTTEYYPEAWRCKCGNRLYMP